MGFGELITIFKGKSELTSKERDEYQALLSKKKKRTYEENKRFFELFQIRKGDLTRKQAKRWAELSLERERTAKEQKDIEILDKKVQPQLVKETFTDYPQ